MADTTALPRHTYFASPIPGRDGCSYWLEDQQQCGLRLDQHPVNLLVSVDDALQIGTAVLHDITPLGPRRRILLTVDQAVGTSFATVNRPSTSVDPADMTAEQRHEELRRVQRDYGSAPIQGNQSILQVWVMALPLREQATLIAGARGCDVTMKTTDEVPIRRLVSALRGAFMVPDYPPDMDEPGGYMIHQPPMGVFKPEQLDSYPVHYVAHLMHAMEVVAYRHPDQGTRNVWDRLYEMVCDYLHVAPEGRHEMTVRLAHKEPT